MDNSQKNKPTLKIVSENDQPPVINSDINTRLKQFKKKRFPVDYYVNGIISKDRTILSQAITLVESQLPKDFTISQQILERCLPHSGNSYRIGITGIPGVGKSSFIESFGKLITDLQRKLVVLAIDPSSERTKGSILGDKTRMEDLSANPDVFIRPSPSAGSLGGVAAKTRETIILCEAAGFNTILIETVGVGQSEVAVHSMVDFFLLLMIAGAGDELQGIKRGIMELADVIAITKADGANIEKAHRAKIEYRNALHLFPPSESGWKPKTLCCSAVENTGLNDIWNEINTYFSNHSDFIKNRRKLQAKYWLHETVQESLKNNFYSNKTLSSKIDEIETLVVKKKLSPSKGADLLLRLYYEYS